ncbi:MAG: multiheme c-type cytochrome [Terriglobales bacterium]
MPNARPSFSDKASTRSARSRNITIIMFMAFLLSGTTLFGQSPTVGDVPRATRDRVSGPYWWPTKGTPAFNAYAGENACSECHSEEASSQVHTPMAEASFRINERTPSLKLAAATLQSGSYRYQISSDQRGSRLVVSSGKQSITAKISWIFGAGVHGQTYILQNQGSFYESQVSSFATLQGMDVTPGHAQLEAGDLKNALGERLSASVAALCFGCHTTYSSTNSKFDVSHATPGVRCEACHGPGVNHVNAMKAGQIDEALKAILNPAHLSPVDLVDFCGACHRTGVDVVLSEGAYGPINVRFQPYRLEKSRCWGSQGDARLTCIACHNPHQPLVQKESSYDAQCLACHGPRDSGSQAANQSHAVCPKATANCTTCHMPKYDVPGMHAKFTDHFIRVVRAGESYPN